ncbi:MAG: hypothetical protein IT287_07555 [Bdellovibrionaceae bacterium]|nr:hypothetical protein [Pseudobdellovibrionaceae bacterium]
MNKFLGLFVFNLVFMTSPVFANDCQNIAEEIRPIFLQTLQNNYYPLMCSDNVDALVKQLKDQGKDLSQAQAVLIRHRAAPFLPIRPLAPKLTFKDKTYLPTPWSFHVFFVVQGLAFDMDYTNTPQALGIQRYMADMWDAGELGSFVVQVKPLSEYSLKDTYGVFQNSILHPVKNLMTLLTNTSCAEESSIKLGQ